MSFSFYIFSHLASVKVSVGHQWERNFLAVISEREEEMPSIIINRWAMMAIIIDDLSFEEFPCFQVCIIDSSLGDGAVQRLDHPQLVGQRRRHDPLLPNCLVHV